MKLTGIFGRLALSNLILLALIAFFIIYVFHKTEHIHRILHQVTSVNLPVIADSDKLVISVQRMNEFRLKYLITGDKGFFERFYSFKNETDGLIEKISLSVDGRMKTGIYSSIANIYTDFALMSEEHINSLNDKEAEHSEQLRYTIESLSEKLTFEIGLLRNTADSEWQNSLERSNKMIENLLYRTLLFMVACIFGAAAVAFFNTQTIAVPLRKLGEKTNDVAAGQFPDKFQLSAPDEINKLASDFNIMISRLKESREQKEEFVSNVSHELKTPLSSIKEATQMLKEGVFKDDPESSEKLLDIINTESERLITSVNGIIEISRLDINNAPYEMKPCSISSILNDIIKKTGPIAARKKITISSKIDENLPDVFADNETISLAAENLISNALKYTPENGEIVVSAKKTDEHLMLISVKDNGRGISEADLPHIFERYRRAKNQQGDVKGTGLGLAIAKKIITRHGGEIWAKSKTGEGSEFLFTLPLSF